MSSRDAAKMQYFRRVSCNIASVTLLNIVGYSTSSVTQHPQPCLQSKTITIIIIIIITLIIIHSIADICRPRGLKACTKLVVAYVGHALEKA
jgi:hypothetical protein